MRTNSPHASLPPQPSSLNLQKSTPNSDQYTPLMDHSHNNRTNERIRIPDQYHSAQQANLEEPYVNNEYSYTLAKAYLKNRLRAKKTSHLTVGSLNVEGMGKCKKTHLPIDQRRRKVA